MRLYVSQIRKYIGGYVIMARYFWEYTSSYLATVRCLSAILLLSSRAIRPHSKLVLTTLLAINVADVQFSLETGHHLTYLEGAKS